MPIQAWQQAVGHISTTSIPRLLSLALKAFYYSERLTQILWLVADNWHYMIPHRIKVLQP
jgi:hypothetical protein